MTATPQLRVVLIGRDLSIKSLEQVLTCHGASNYICVPSIDAAEWLTRDGFDADLLIVHEALLPSPLDVMRLRKSNPQSIVMPTASICDTDEIRGALSAAARFRQRRKATQSLERPTLFASFGRRWAWSRRAVA